MIWGGEDQDSFEIAADGSAFDPATGHWHEIPEAPIEGRCVHDAFWTGSELIVWAGSTGPDHLATCYRDGARYGPETDERRELPSAPMEPRAHAAAVWSGSELLV